MQAGNEETGAVTIDKFTYYDFYADNFFQEPSHFRPEFSQSEWLEMQIGFLQNHRYHTDFCKNALEASKQQHLEKLIKAAER